MAEFKMPTGKMTPPMKGSRPGKVSRDYFQPEIDATSPKEKFKGKGYGEGHDMAKLGANKPYKV